MWEFLQGFSDWNGENGISLEPKDGFNYISYIYICTLWLFNVAMENHHF